MELMNTPFVKTIMNNRSGFTLVEMLIAMTLGSLVMTAVYSSYLSQQKTYIVQNQMAGMRQNIRAALYYMERELRMAGCDPTGNAGAGIEVAQANTIQFTMDITGGESDGKDNDSDGTVDEAAEDIYPDGKTTGTDEDITYAINDNNGDGDTDLERTDNGVTRLIAENIDALDFVYLDKNSAVLPFPIADLSDIRAVQVTVVARTEQMDNDYTNSVEYKNKQGTTILTAQNDHFRRIMMTTHIKCRNLGL
ncbi:MAG TPA: prepilin-type N-terminal cleavage/methylation domain-containing protein [Deltaproteobacteria bacterium]|nr:prepilin-type N-terminal cleavage/methylation domain-containing protein [Deltaproteobacteria bacterium]